MRPDRFQTLMADALPAVPGITKVETFADAGFTYSWYGLILHHHNGARSWWQPTARSRNGDRYDQPEGEPVTGERLAEQPLPDLGGNPISTADVEAALVAVFTRADTIGEAAKIERYSTREKPGAVSHGFSIEFHDGSALYVNGLATARQGEDPRSSRYFTLDAAI